jgi:hypothetical protein
MLVFAVDFEVSHIAVYRSLLQKMDSGLQHPV